MKDAASPHSSNSGISSVAQGAVVSEEAASADFAQFGERNLDKLSWLYPLVNNRVGAALRLELRHRQLFFIRDGAIIDEIGYGEDGLRFHERDKGKPLHRPEDLKENGYWLVAPKINARAAYQALQEVDDGAYYSLFSNQCQDWAHRVESRALAVQKHEALPAPENTSAAREKPIPPTVPAAWYFGVIAVLVGILGLGSPLAAGAHYLRFVAILLVAIGVSDSVYALSSREWKTMLSTLLLGIISVVGAVMLWINDYLLLTNSNALLAVFLAVAGGTRILLALRSRPISAWLGTLFTGVALVATAFVAWHYREGTTGAWLLGMTLSVSFLFAGGSTIWLNWRLRSIDQALPRRL
jgi:uncharacterized membrane protein HdeD (DUF308 family)